MSPHNPRRAMISVSCSIWLAPRRVEGHTRNTLEVR